MVGVEPSQELYRTAQQQLGPQAEIYGSTWQSIHLPPASFDAITLWDVLEHVSDPVSFLERCAFLLKHGGSVCQRSRSRQLVIAHSRFTVASLIARAPELL